MLPEAVEADAVRMVRKGQLMDTGPISEYQRDRAGGAFYCPISATLDGQVQGAQAAEGSPTAVSPFPLLDAGWTGCSSGPV